jgi:hypothetical protein
MTCTDCFLYYFKYNYILMSSVKVQILTASLTVGKQEYPVTHVDYRATMNQWPSIQVEVLPGV